MPASGERGCTRRALTCTLAVLPWLVSCLGTGILGERTFAPGEATATAEGVRIELLHARYEDEMVEVDLAVANGTESVVSVDRDGLMLALDELEYPTDVGSEAAPLRPSPDGKPLAEAVTEVPPQGRGTLRVRFRIGHPMRDVGTVLVRSIKRDGRWLDPFRLELPPAPAQPGPA